MIEEGEGFDLESNWKDGLQYGDTTSWHTNGQLKEKCNFLNGRLEGLAIGWDVNGEKEFEITFKDGEKVVHLE